MAIVPRASSNATIDPVIQVMESVISKEDDCPIRQTNLRRMEILVECIGLFRDQQKALPEVKKIWLQLLQNRIAEGKRLIDRWGARQSSLYRVRRNPRRISREIRVWNAFFDEFCQTFQSDLSILVTSPQFVSPKPLSMEEAFPHLAAYDFVGWGILHARDQVTSRIEKSDQVQIIGVYGKPGVGKTSLLNLLYNHYRYGPSSNVFNKVIWVRVSQQNDILELQGRLIDATGEHIPNDRLAFVAPRKQREMKSFKYLKAKKFLLVLDDLRSELDLQELGVPFGDPYSKVLFSTRRKDVIRKMGAEKFIEIQPLSKDEGWKMFSSVAFKDDEVSMAIQERARRFADGCRGVPLAINVVGSMIRQSFPTSDPPLDADLNTLLRRSYDALPNSNVKNCFLYCAMYIENQEIDSRELVQMWIGEGLVKSKQGTHLMDMAIGHRYLKILVDRCLFRIVKQKKDVWPRYYLSVHVIRRIRVHHVIRDMAMSIGQKEENCLFMAGQNLRFFREVHNENCRRLSLANNYIEDLPTDLRCPKPASLTLEGNRYLTEPPSEFLQSLTSLRALNLSRTNIISVSQSVGQLRVLEFFSLSSLCLSDLPEQICDLSRLQFLDFSYCSFLQSLPLNIEKLINLKHLDLLGCNR